MRLFAYVAVLAGGLALGGPGLAGEDGKVRIRPLGEQAVAPLEQMPGSAEELSEAYDETKKSVEELSFGGVGDILRMLENSTGEIRGLRERIETNEEVSFDDVVRTLEKVSQRFWRIAEEAPEIIQSQLEDLGDLKAVQRRIGANIDELLSTVGRLKERNKTLEREIELANERSQSTRRLEIERQMNASIINSHETAIANWEIFELRHGRALEVLQEQGVGVEDLLFALQANARVYAAAADAAELTREVRTALDELDQVINIGDVVNQMVKSWDDLDIIMEELRLDFHEIPGF